MMQNSTVPNSSFMSLLTSLETNEFNTQISATSYQLRYTNIIWISCNFNSITSTTT